MLEDVDRNRERRARHGRRRDTRDDCSRPTRLDKHPAKLFGAKTDLLRVQVYAPSPEPPQQGKANGQAKVCVWCVCTKNRGP
jgi:hypothetical protein